MGVPRDPALGVPHFIAGSVASSLHGVARSTIDVDVMAQPRLSHVDELVKRLGDAYYADPDAMTDAIRRQSMFNVVEPGGAETYALATAEDVILHKLLWYRDGGGVSERQWSDVLGVMRVQRDTLDRAYMDEWATELGISDLLVRARKEAGLA